MSYSEKIEHEGVVRSVNGHDVQVEIVSASACSACHAKGACTSADLQDKVVDINQSIEGVKPGDIVTIVGEKRTGNQAVILAYVIPLLLVVVVLVLMVSLTHNEVKSALYALLSLAPYYVVLSMFSKRLKSKFAFQIKK